MRRLRRAQSSRAEFGMELLPCLPLLLLSPKIRSLLNEELEFFVTFASFCRSPFVYSVCFVVETPLCPELELLRYLRVLL